MERAANPEATTGVDDPEYNALLTSMKVALTDYFQKKIAKMNESCQQSHASQAESIQRVEKKLDKVNEAMGVDRKEALEVVKASAQQATKEIEIKKEEFVHAMDSIRLDVKTDLNIFRQEKKELMKEVEHMQDVSGPQQVGELQKQVKDLADSVVQVSNKVLQVEQKQDNSTFSFIDRTHSDQQVKALAVDIQTIQADQQGLRGEIQNLQRDIHQMEPDQAATRGTGARQRERDNSRSIIQQMPKLPFFDGQTSWKTFMNTFELYSTASDWNQRERFNAIQLCMRNKAVDYLRSQQKQGKCQDYRSLVMKMQERFDRKLDPFLKRSEFFAMMQGHDESIEEWADRVLDVGLEAFENVPDDVREEEFVRRFVMGSIDKEAAQFVINSRPATLEDAIARMKSHQENASLIFGRKKVRGIEVEATDEMYIRAMNKVVSDEKPNRVHFGSSPKRFEKSDRQGDAEKIVNALGDGFDRVLKKLDDQHQEQKKILQDIKSKGRTGACFYCGSEEHWANKCPNKTPSRSNSRERIVCFNCQESGHFMKDCPKGVKSGWNKSPSASPSTPRKQEN